MNIFDQFDRLSFWLGFLTAGLLGFLVYRLRKHWVPLKEFFRERLKTVKIKQSSSFDGSLRQEVLRRAQSSHLTRTLFALDEVLIVPKIQAPAKRIDPLNADLIESAQPIVLPNLPLVPQFSSQYNCETIALPRLLRLGLNMAIIGHPGSGKTTALAYLASLFARKDVSLGPLGHIFPVYLHFSDLYGSTLSEPDPVKALIKALSWNVSTGQRTQLSGFIQKQIQDNKAILLLDGLDEIPDGQYDQALKFLSSLLNSRPKLRVVTTASFDRAYGLLDLKIEPMPIAGWTRADITHFINRWGGLWQKFFSSGPDHVESSDEVLLAQWQTSGAEYFSPIEWTTRLWGLYAGDLMGARGMDGITSYCMRLQQHGVDVQRVGMVADHMLVHRQHLISYIDAEKMFSEIIIPAATPASDISFEPGNLTQNEVTFQAPVETEKPTGRGSIGERTIDILVDYGLLRESVDEQLAFTSPVVWGFLSSLNTKESEFEPRLSIQDTWSVESEALHYRLQTDKTDWLKAYLSEDREPFYTKTIQAALWSRDLPDKDPGRAQVLRYLLQRAKLEATPYQTRLSLLAATAISNDLTIPQLIRQLTEAPEPALRQAAILGTGALRDSKAFNILISALNDPVLSIRWAACFALAALETTESRKAAKTVMDRSDEPLRLATAEALASRPPWGHELLKLAETSADLLTRQAMVFGLLHVQAPWAIDTLERVAAEDSQWVVRNFANQSLEYLQKIKRHSTKQFAQPSETPWIVAFASRHGHGVPKGDAILPLLLKAVESGSDEEKVAAVQFLGSFADKAAAEALKTCFTSPDVDLQRAAYDSLWISTFTRKPETIH